MHAWQPAIPDKFLLSLLFCTVGVHFGYARNRSGTAAGALIAVLDVNGSTDESAAIINGSNVSFGLCLLFVISKL
ncbi:unnamed protein product [Litomosoides sigmodontis]|uniref:Uncharacterized protein n=1 Tax=Litomosoides sigmodontis TaxID=42156 RepID=A0A3P6SIF3_LITSI|nr:unnamed protein product [Litomosoides sigmodontis]